MQIEVGDMIHWDIPNDPDDYDVGWVVHVENRASSQGLQRLVYIRWLFEDGVDHLWQQTIISNEYIKVTKGGQDDR